MGGNGDRNIPTTTASLGPGRTALDESTSWSHSCALLDDGSVVCWGEGGNGKLGNGGTQTKLSPTPVTGFGPSTPVKQISSGLEHTCALLVNGSVSCWGNNAYGALGRGGTSGINTQPALVVGLENKNIVFIDAGYHSTCAVEDTGNAYCWGWNNHGQLGDGTFTSRTQPVEVLSLGFNRKATKVSTNFRHTCFLLDDASVNCWGDNWLGALGDGTFTDSYLPRVYANRTVPSPKVQSIVLNNNNQRFYSMEKCLNSWIHHHSQSHSKLHWVCRLIQRRWCSLENPNIPQNPSGPLRCLIRIVLNQVTILSKFSRTPIWIQFLTWTILTMTTMECRMNWMPAQPKPEIQH